MDADLDDDRLIRVAPGTPLAYNVADPPNEPSLLLELSEHSFTFGLLRKLPSQWENPAQRQIRLVSVQAAIASCARVSPDFKPVSFMKIFVSVAALERLDRLLRGVAGSFDSPTSWDQAIQLARSFYSRLGSDAEVLVEGDFSFNQNQASAPASWIEQSLAFSSVTDGGSSLRVFTELHAAVGGFGTEASRDPGSNGRLQETQEILSGTVVPATFLHSTALNMRRREAGPNLALFLSCTLPENIRCAIGSPGALLEELSAAIRFRDPSTRPDVVSQRLGGVISSLPLLRVLLGDVSVASRADMAALLLDATGLASLDPSNVSAYPVLENALQPFKYLVPSVIVDKASVISAIGRASRSMRERSTASAPGPSASSAEASTEPPRPVNNHVLHERINSPSVQAAVSDLRAVRDGDNVGLLLAALRSGAPLVMAIPAGLHSSAISTIPELSRLRNSSIFNAAALKQILTSERGTRPDGSVAVATESGAGGLIFTVALSRSLFSYNIDASSLARVMDQYLRGMGLWTAAEPTFVELLTDPDFAPLAESKLSALFEALSLDAASLRRLFGLVRGIRSVGAGDPFSAAENHARLLAEAAERDLRLYSDGVRAALHLPDAAVPPFVIQQTEETYRNLAAAADTNRGLVEANPGLLQQLSPRPNAPRSRDENPRPRPKKEQSQSSKKPRAKQPDDKYYDLPLHSGDRYVRVSGGNFVWRSAANSTFSAWKGAIVKEWQRLTKSKAIPRLDAILSAKSSPELRAANAAGADPDQVVEPDGWLEVRDRFAIPDFRLPGGN